MRQTGVSRCGIQALLKKHQETGQVEDKPRSGVTSQSLRFLEASDASTYEEEVGKSYKNPGYSQQ